MSAVLHCLLQVVDLTQMLHPCVVDHGEGDELLERQRDLVCAVLHRLLDVDRHVDAFLSIGERDKDIFQARLLLVDVFDDWQRLLAHQLHLTVV